LGKVEGALPLQQPLLSLKRELKRGEASLTKSIPPPFIREGDIGGGLTPLGNLTGLINNLSKGGFRL